MVNESAMKMSIILRLAAILAVVSAGRDNQGTEFIIGFMDNLIFPRTSANDLELFITTVSNTPAQVTITAPLYDSSLSRSITVTRGNIEKVTLPWRIRANGCKKEGKGVWIQATQEITVYGVNKETYSTDAFVALPTDVIGTEYYAMTFKTDAEMMIIASQDNTAVTVKFPSPSSRAISISYGNRNYGSGSTLTETLNKFQTLHLRQTHSGADFTGAYITSTKPVSVMSGNYKIAIPTSGSADHLVEQMIPVDAWGKEFATVSTPSRRIGDLVRVVACEDNTRVTLGGSSTITLSKAGNFKEWDIPTGQYKAISSDKPVMAAIFSKTFKNDGNEGGDPAMSLIVPTPQFAADYTFSTVRTPTGDFKNYLTLVIEGSKTSGLRFDEKTISSSWSNVAGSTLKATSFKVSSGAHNVYHTDPLATFQAFASGVERANSYTYLAGLRLAQINVICVPSQVVVGDTVDNDCDGRVDEEANNGVDDDGDGAIDEDLAHPPRIDGSWGQWQAWADCSVTCSTGTEYMRRHCDNPAPQNNGLDCVGDSEYTRSCDRGACPVNGGWTSYGSWSSCSVTCATGTRTRTRSCTNPSPAHGGAQCSGDSSDSKTCDTGISCAVDGGWSSYGAWGSCSVTCETGTRTRTRSCTNPAPANGGAQCSGSTTDTKSCNAGIMCPIDGGWTSYGSWGSCSVTCEQGTRTRTRSCTSPAPQHNGANCAGSDTDTKSCDAGIMCPIDGGWTSYGSWGSCSVTCEQGTRTRTRSCTSPAPQHNGANCAGSDTDTKTCDAGIMCPIDGGWTSYGSWGSCSVTCEQGTRTRTRSCTSPAPQHNGANCAGSDTDTKTCDAGIMCPIDGGWSNYGAWSSCSVTCESGTYTRTRSCTNPAPQHNGAQCGGSTTQTGNCDAGIMCPIDGGWTVWSQWGACSVTCEIGQQTRARSCTNPAPQHNGAQCQGSTSDTRSCDAGIMCPIDGVWGAWGSWSACSTTCDPGVHTRSRVCDNPTPQYNGAYCPNTNVSSDTCLVVMCPVDGAWTTWSAWNPCSSTCDQGTTTRTRTCSNPPAMYGGANCTGHLEELDICNDGSCLQMYINQQLGITQGPTVDGGWGQWEAWGSCSSSCGWGVSMRSRSCNSPAPANGGAECSGDYSQQEACFDTPCPGQSEPQRDANGSYIQACPIRWFPCQSGAQTCVHYLKKCDCEADCEDASDEDPEYASCTMSITDCRNTAPKSLPSAMSIFLSVASLLLTLTAWGRA